MDSMHIHCTVHPHRTGLYTLQCLFQALYDISTKLQICKMNKGQDNTALLLSMFKDNSAKDRAVALVCHAISFSVGTLHVCEKTTWPVITCASTVKCSNIQLLEL